MTITERNIEDVWMTNPPNAGSTSSLDVTAEPVNGKHRRPRPLDVGKLLEKHRAELKDIDRELADARADVKALEYNRKYTRGQINHDEAILGEKRTAWPADEPRPGRKPAKKATPDQ